MDRRTKKLKVASDPFWAWLAGFVDGDGTITFDNRHRRRATLAITQKEPEPLKLIRRRLGTGSLYLPQSHPYWRLSFGSQATRAICKKILPYLVSVDKRMRAKEAIAWRAATTHAHNYDKKPNYLAVVNAYLAGESLDMVATRLGVARSTAARWLRRARAVRALSDSQALRRAREEKEKP